jgi:hypothetical protein
MKPNRPKPILFQMPGCIEVENDARKQAKVHIAAGNSCIPNTI